MRMTLNALHRSQYHQLEVAAKGGHIYRLLAQLRLSGDFELIAVFPEALSADQTHAELYESLLGTRPLTGPNGEPLERVETGWIQWPGDTRCNGQEERIIFHAAVPGSAPSVRIQLPGMDAPALVDLATIGFQSVEVAHDGWSFAYAEAAGVMVARVTLYSDEIGWPPPFHVATAEEDGGAQYYSHTGFTDARFLTRSQLPTLLGYEIETRSNP